MKKVGVITFSDTTHNYGQILQCFAMQQILKRIGCEPYLVQYDKNTRCSYRYLTLRSKIVKFLGSVSYLYKKKNDTGKKVCLQPESNEPGRRFDEFIKKNIRVLYFKTINDLYKNPPDAEAFICGSDQIWGAGTPLFYLDFIRKKETKKIAYAPSFGGVKFNVLDLLKLKLLLKDFAHIGVREYDGVDICYKCGRRDAIVVPDPTLILPVDEYKRIASNKLVPDSKYVFVYMLKNTTDFNIYEFEKDAKRRGLKVIYVTANGLTDDFPKLYPSIEEWLGLIENASYVVTNSFHCAVFSILYNKIFKVCLLKGSFSKMNVRFNNLFEHYNINMTDSVYDMKINNNVINNIIKKDIDQYTLMLHSWIYE